MALALIRFEVAVTFSAKDTNGAQTWRTKSFELISTGADDDAKRNNAAAEAASLVVDIAQFSEAQIVAYSMRDIWEDSTEVTAVASVYKEALMTVALNDNGTKKGTLTIPAPADVVINSGQVIVTAQATVDLLDHFMAAEGTRLSDGETVRDVSPIVTSRVRSVSSGKNY